MKFYIGIKKFNECSVKVRTEDGDRPLEPRFDLANHSPTGFGFGYGGSGPSQLALAICADALGDDDQALRVYQAFKAAHVANWVQGTFEISDLQVQGFAAQAAQIGAAR